MTSSQGASNLREEGLQMTCTFSRSVLPWARPATKASRKVERGSPVDHVLSRDSVSRISSFLRGHYPTSLTPSNSILSLLVLPREFWIRQQRKCHAHPERRTLACSFSPFVFCAFSSFDGRRQGEWTPAHRPAHHALPGPALCRRQQQPDEGSPPRISSDAARGRRWTILVTAPCRTR